jgi:magnesium-protoporphyrin O-methyltransferase
VAPGCCRADARAGTDRFFSAEAARYARRFRRKGLERVQRLLAEGIPAAALDRGSILEIGCGVGGLHLTLLGRGAASATGIDISDGMIQRARELARERGLGGAATHLAGDFVELSPTLPAADIVILDKVVCCYDDLEGLLDASLSRAARVYAISYPRGLTRMGFALLALLGRVFRWPFVPRWHDWDAMLLRIRQAGFALRSAAETPFWSVRVFERL